MSPNVRALRLDAPVSPELLARLRSDLAAELDALGVSGDACDAVLRALARRSRALADFDADGLRRYVRRLVDRWLLRAVERLALPEPPDLATRRAALLALDVGRVWPDELMNEPSPGFLVALQGALPVAVPPAAPLAMPAQPLHAAAMPAQPTPGRGHFRLRRLAVFGVSAVLVAGAVWMLSRVFAPGGLSAVEYTLMALFVVNFAWIALSFWSALVGLVVNLRGGDLAGLAPPLPREIPLTAAFARPLAVVMPTYNEAPRRVLLAVETLYRELDALGVLNAFEFFVLSDSTDPDVWLAEEAVWDDTRRRLGATGRLFYRRRYQNHARKAGNIADFCTRWGARYEAMLVLDADSVMSGETVVALARLLATNPQAAILQTVPRLVNRYTPFARAQQFATAMYGPVLASGYAWWFGPDSNYWGHNALIRVAAFAAHAGMPVLPGKPPFGGHILSHDFVEAALLRRAGWRNYLLPQLAGSYEESPPSLLDHAARDRRWCQGNLQHAGLLRARGLYGLSRFHLLNGIMAYLASPLWLAFIVTGLVAAVQGKFELPVYFFPDRTPYPVWHVMDPVMARWLLGATMGVLLVPKLFGWWAVAARRDTARGFGGAGRALASVIAETIYSTLSAPAQMLLQTRAVREVLRGRDAGWQTQTRDDRGMPLRACHAGLRWHASLGTLFAAAAWYVYPGLFGWMLPAVLGLWLAVPLAWLGARPALGRNLRAWGIFVTPEERTLPPVLVRLHTLTAAHPEGAIRPALARVLESPVDAARHLALLSQLPPAELTAPMALARCRAEEALPSTLEALFPRELQASALADRRAVMRLVARCATPPVAAVHGVSREDR
ncbi:MAG: glucans biosynthesis glucosyltransferase MdoH [Gammaproteobacteria bacterium]|nr:glucans biosynthesis glucosyltransferase MdoH [Gammaproteobacteria bacterium]